MHSGVTRLRWTFVWQSLLGKPCRHWEQKWEHCPALYPVHYLCSDQYLRRFSVPGFCAEEWWLPRCDPHLEVKTTEVITTSGTAASTNLGMTDRKTGWLHTFLRSASELFSCGQTKKPHRNTLTEVLCITAHRTLSLPPNYFSLQTLHESSCSLGQWLKSLLLGCEAYFFYRSRVRALL